MRLCSFGTAISRLYFNPHRPKTESEMTSKKATFQWNPYLQHQLDICIDFLVNRTLLYYPNFSLTFQIRTDASDVGIGAIVYQIGNNDEIHPVHFYSKKLSSTQRRNFSIVEK
eukprot:NODE_833_length_3618_cov_0.950270.p4 type:complete len:113 gc:universal NODE_833_length_3618_cov_0.950270:1363-1025(-)